MNSFAAVKTIRVTEKGTRQSDALNQYTVVADPRATKAEIRRAVQELFKVTVIKVNTLNVRGKARRRRTPMAGRAPNWKKAIVTLRKEDKIRLT
jgi:large subunit ribosomal protein L23